MSELFAGWRAEYNGWIAAARPLLEAGQWGDGYAMYPWAEPEGTPFTPLAAPLGAARLGVVSTAGFYIPGLHERFDAENVEGDVTFRVLPSTVVAAELAIAHEHYEHDAALADWNSVLPLDHLRALVAEGRLGGLGPIFSTSGYCSDVGALLDRTVPAIVAQAQCDAVLLVMV